MIRTRNLQHVILDLSVPGAITASAGQRSAMVPFAGFISNIKAKALTGTLATTFDIDKNGTSIFTTNPYVTGTVFTSGGALTTDPPQVAAGDILSLDVDDIGAGAPTYLSVLITISKQNPAAVTNLADHNEVL